MIYMDNAATTRPLPSVLETFQQVSETYYYNTASIHQAGRKADELLTLSRRQILDIADLNSYDCIFTSGATESNNIAIQSVLGRKKQFGSTILVSELEHPSVINVIDALKDDFEVKFIRTTWNGSVDLSHLTELLDDDVIFVTVMALNNIVGSRQPVEDIVEILKDYPKVHFHVDATQAVGKTTVDYHSVDSLSISAHKFYGVKGAGALIVKDRKYIAPVYFGGGHEYNIRSGTVNLPAVAAMARAMRISAGEGRDKADLIAGYNKRIREELAGLSSIVIQPGDVPHILNISYAGAKGEVVVNALAAHDIMVSTTSACASKLAELNETLTAMNNSRAVIEGSIRISLSNYTSEDEVYELIKALREVYEELGDVLI